MAQPPSPSPQHLLNLTDTGGAGKILIVQAGRGGAGKREIDQKRKTKRIILRYSTSQGTVHRDRQNQTLLIMFTCRDL